MTAAVRLDPTDVGTARLASLSVRDFRNLARLELEVPTEGLVLVGENGQGKTNLLEAIYYLELLRSARGARDVDLVRFGSDGFHLAAMVESDRAREIRVGFERAGKRKRVRLDGVVADRVGDALGALPAVMFAPSDVELVAGAPAARRRFLDILLALTAPRGEYLSALQRYRMALAHRNAALREAARASSRGGGAHEHRISVWEAPLAEHGATLWRERRTWVASMAERFGALCHAIGELVPVVMRYVSSIGEPDDARGALADALASQRAHDVRRCVTHAGPHRDDVSLTIEIDGTPRDLRAFGSAGQQRTAAIALRMLEARTFGERRGTAPVFLLDDPFAELDARRSARILELLEAGGLGQTVLAVPRESDIPRPLRDLARFRIREGQLSPWSPA